MKTALKFITLFLISVAIIASLLIVWRQSRPIMEKYNLCEAKICDIYRNVVLYGELVAQNEVTLRAQISGTIDKIYVNPGDFVNTGTLIASIEMKQDPSMVVSGEGAVADAELVLEQQRQETERAHRLFEKGIITKQELNNQDFMLRRAEEKLMTAKRSFEVVRQGYSKLSRQQNITEVRSNVEGYVLALPYKEKEMVIGSSLGSPGSPIAKIGNINNLEFKGVVDESQVAKLHNGQNINLIIAALPSDTIHTTLDYISLDCQKINGIKQYEVRSSIQPSHVKELNLRSGYSVNAYVNIAEAYNVVAIAESTISYENAKPVVYLLLSQDKDGNNQQFRKQEVELGISDGLVVEVKSGVSSGDILRSNTIVK